MGFDRIKNLIFEWNRQYADNITVPHSNEIVYRMATDKSIFSPIRLMCAIQRCGWDPLTSSLSAVLQRPGEGPKHTIQRATTYAGDVDFSNSTHLTSAAVVQGTTDGQIYTQFDNKKSVCSLWLSDDRVKWWSHITLAEATNTLLRARATFDLICQHLLSLHHNRIDLSSNSVNFKPTNKNQKSVTLQTFMCTTTLVRLFDVNHNPFWGSKIPLLDISDELRLHTDRDGWVTPSLFGFYGLCPTDAVAADEDQSFPTVKECVKQWERSCSSQSSINIKRVHCKNKVRSSAV